MKSKAKNRIKTFSLTFFLSSIAVLMGGCTEEGFSHCGGAEVHFRYTKHTHGGDRFAAEVKRITLYVFDSENLFVGSYSNQEGSLSENYFMPLDIKPGTYSFVAWGNLCDHFDVTPFIVGQTRLEQALLTYKHPAAVVNDCLGEALFHGSLLNAEIKSNRAGKQNITLDLTRNTNAIRVIITPIGVPESRATRATPEFSCTITSDDTAYKFDNTIVGSGQRLYTPQSTQQNDKIISDFLILRELKDGSTGSKLIITRHLANGTDQQIRNTSLAPLLLAQSKTGDLDIDHDYTLDIVLDYTGTEVTVTINGWVVNESGGVVG